MRRSAISMVAFLMTLACVLVACSDGETEEATAERATTNVLAKGVPTTAAPATTAPATPVVSESSEGATVADPWSLSEVEDPTTQEEVNVIFLGMPDDIDGMAASRDDPEHVGFVDYEGNSSHAQIAWSEAGLDATMAIESLTVIQGPDGLFNASGDLDSSDTFVWMKAATVPTPVDDQVFLAWQGDPTDGWLFSVEADTPQHRDAVIEAFIARASTQPHVSAHMGDSWVF